MIFGIDSHKARYTNVFFINKKKKKKKEEEEEDWTRPPNVAF